MEKLLNNMRITVKQIKRLTVKSQSGLVLGHVQDIIIDVDSQTIIQYVVKQLPVVSKEYLINRGQVLSMDEKFLIVEDGLKKEKKEAEEIKPIDISAESAAFRTQFIEEIN